MKPALIVATLAAFSISSVAQAATAPAIGANRPTPASTFSVGGMRVEKFGSGDPALIFIPGLSSGSWVWDSQIPEFSATHAVYVVTLPGFDGVPPAKFSPPLIDQADANVVQLIQQEHLAKPILIGHSLGGFLAIRLAEEHSDLLRGIVTVDGLPVFPTMVQSTADQRKAAADQIATSVRLSTPQEFAQDNARTIAMMVTDPTAAAQVAALTIKVDQASVAEYSDEMFSADLRPSLGKITIPVLVVAPVPAKVPPTYPQFMQGMTPAQLETTFVGFDKTLFTGAPNVTVVPIPNSAHFAMIDQPAALTKAIADFIGKL